jgi:threonylcarbamoyladenosine tRNA methylthiotransferase MtaB
MEQKPKVAFYTLGCKLNFSETSTISRNFEQEGFEKVGFEKFADVYVINTCSVTENADKECKRIVKSALKINPEGYVCVVGCYAQLKPEEISKIEGVDLVLGATEKFKISQYIGNLQKKQTTEIHSCEIEDANFFTGSFSIGDRTRSFLKVQDGCDYPCTYCTIPLARGISRSDSLENVVENAKKIAQQGIKEIVLTGVNIGDYGKGELGNKKHQHTFLDLVKELDEVEDIERIRISSIEPNLLKNETIEFVSQSKRFVPHFHIPLQSGSDTVLKAMKRRYLTALYKERVERIKESMPHAAIGVDVIVGFPGESDNDFEETYNFLNSLDISYLHVFTYSKRDNTAASLMDQQVDEKTKNERNKRLRILSIKKRLHFYEKNINKIYPVLFEAENKDGFMYGFTPNYIKTKVDYDKNLINRVLEVKLRELDKDGNIVGEIIAINEPNHILQ